MKCLLFFFERTTWRTLCYQTFSSTPCSNSVSFHCGSCFVYWKHRHPHYLLPKCRLVVCHIDLCMMYRPGLSLLLFYGDFSIVLNLIYMSINMCVALNGGFIASFISSIHLGYKFCLAEKAAYYKPQMKDLSWWWMAYKFREGLCTVKPVLKFLWSCPASERVSTCSPNRGFFFYNQSNQDTASD